MLDGYWLELKLVIRSLARRPLYAIVTIAVLAIAVGANATSFSVYYGLFKRPLPYPDEERLVMVYNSYPRAGLQDAGTSIPDYVDRRDRAGALEELAIYNSIGRALELDGELEHLLLLRVSPSLFNVLGLQPSLGRPFTEEEAVPGQDRVILLSYQSWQSLFGGAADVIGTDIYLDGEAFRVLGVLPRELAFPRRDYAGWVPYGWEPAAAADDQRFRQRSRSVGKLKRGASIDQLRAQMDAIIAANAEWDGQTRRFVESAGFSGGVMSVRQFLVGDLRTAAWVLQAIMFAVLVLACVNIGNLQLTRVVGRRSEFAIRSALGARPGELLRPILAESTVLAAAGALLGMMLAVLGLIIVSRLGLDRANQGFEYALDPAVSAFTVLVAVLASLAANLTAAWSLRRAPPAGVLREASRLDGSNSASNRTRQVAVVVQVAISVALIAGAGTLAHRFVQTVDVGPGFETEKILTARYWLPDEQYQTDEQRARFVVNVLAEAAALPGVRTAAYTAVLPFSGNQWAGGFAIDGQDTGPGDPSQNAHIRSVSGDYFDALSIPLIEGRAFLDGDSDRVVVIDELLAKRYWPDGSALGERIRLNDDDDWSTVVGIVPTIHHDDLVTPIDRGTTYWPVRQRPLSDGMLVVKSEIAPDLLVRPLQDAVATVDPRIPLSDARTLESRLSDVIGPQRATLLSAMLFATLAMVLAVIGIYSAIAWLVADRRPELGLRMALGADRRRIVTMVMYRASQLLGAGIAAGAVLSIGASRLMAAYLPYVDGMHLFTITAACAVLVFIGLAASFVPSLRAGYTSPAHALRSA